MITVVKLGGSLLSARVLPACLAKLADYPGQVFIVPGGGVFADQVRAAQRQWGFDDVAAHRMAILAMQQMAWLFHSLRPEFAVFGKVATAGDCAKAAIWSPCLQELEQAGIAASWDITSDSLAAWLAGQVAADELLLVKSCPIEPEAPLALLRQQGIIDAGFVEFVSRAGFKTTVINKDRFLSSHAQIH
ncbi:amino acid kinase family protein [Methylomonas rivi]|uniref:Uridylate kinase n=1 Tax=Methylomonas rivi TaxID=2952226 RepID=A0ABT1U664_9GAMM|nr:uridylate kinase [Methylomonas sp. WSC-6]MCQ8128541.1 uridylate kinase [Methylomonas sp. WSC-6]